MTGRTRLALVGAVTVIAAAVAVGSVVVSHTGQARAVARATPVAQRAEMPAGPYLVFRNTARGADYGQVAIVSAADPSGPRRMTGRSCDRVFATAGDTICLASKAGLVTTYSAEVLNAALTSAEQALPLTGVPSRARLSSDGRLAATTSFVAGDSYAATDFSTRTVISTIGDSAETSGSVDLEDFTLMDHGAAVAPPDRNYWGVTFASDDNTFFATVKFGGVTHLARGTLSDRVITTLGTDAECPSLSPDGRSIVYKQHGSLPPGQWRLVRYDVASATVTPLSETRSVDDQVEWVDNSHVVYGMPRTGVDAGITDVWKVGIDGSQPPQVFIPQAWSPALVAGTPGAGN